MTGIREPYPTERLLSSWGESVIERARRKPELRPGYVHFLPGEPQYLNAFGGQNHILDFLTHALLSMPENAQALRPILFTGPPGLGKTTLAKVIAHELISRAGILELPPPDFIEVFPADIPNVKALDAVMERVFRQEGSVLFIDEIHDCKEESHWRKLYLFLNENRYKFEQAEHPIQMPPTTVLAATTDDGDLPEPLKRRFTTWRFVTATPDELREMVMKRPFGISEAGLDLIIDRFGIDGKPWEVLQIYDQAVVYAQGKGHVIVHEEDVEQALANKGIDAYGLGVEEREVIKALLSVPPRKLPGADERVHILSEANIIGMTGLHKALYAKVIKPRLLKRGLLTIRTGQVLTEKAVQIYGSYYAPQLYVKEPQKVTAEPQQLIDRY